MPQKRTRPTRTRPTRKTKTRPSRTTKTTVGEEVDMIAVSSSNLEEIGYDYTAQNLFIKFKNSFYIYYEVPEDIFNGLLSAGSKGEYHHENIKWSYRYSKIS